VRLLISLIQLLVLDSRESSGSVSGRFAPPRLLETTHGRNPRNMIRRSVWFSGSFPSTASPSKNPELVNYALFLQREGYRPSAIEMNLKVLKKLPAVEAESAKTAILDSLGRKELRSSCSIASGNNGLAKSQRRMGLRSKIGPVSEETYQLIVETRVKLTLR